MRLLTAIMLCLGLTQYAAATCNDDYDCRFGAVCLKVNGPYQPGKCATGEHGAGIYGNSTQGHQIQGCQFSSQCPATYSCEREPGQQYGMCIKH